MRFSVIIPTLNRREVLARAVASARAQNFPQEQFEILVLDNGSTDGTDALVRELNADGGKPIRYVREPRPGLHHARHRAARDAHGWILAFTDDDAEVTPDWLSALNTAYGDPQVAAAGGPIHIRWTTPPPEWVPSLGGFGELDLGMRRMELSWPHTIYGGNFSVRRELVFEAGGFNPDTSVEDRLVGDGEMGLCRKLYAAGWKIIYVPEALVYHVQNGGRITLSQMRHRYAQQGRFSTYTTYKTRQPSAIGLLARAGKMLLRAGMNELAAVGARASDAQSYYRRRVQAAAALASAGYYARLLRSPHFRQVVLRENWIDGV